MAEDEEIGPSDTTALEQVRKQAGQLNIGYSVPNFCSSPMSRTATLRKCIAKAGQKFLSAP